MPKYNLYKLTAIILFFISCSKSEDNQLPPPTQLTVKISSTNPLNSKIEWTNTGNLQNKITYYDLYLGDELIAEHIDGNTFEFEELKGLTEYQGKVIAKDINNKTITSTEYKFFTDKKQFEGNVELKSQEDIDNFTSKGYNIINGNLIINGEASNITTLFSFTDLNQINGDLFVVNTTLENLNGLENTTLASPDARLVIINNDELTNIEAVPNVTSVSSLRILGNNVLQNLNGLHNLKTIQQELSIGLNPAITNLNTLQNLSFAHKINITGNDALENLHGLEQIKNINTIVIKNNTSLKTMEGLQNLTSCELYFTIENNGQLHSLKGLSKLTSTGAIKIINNASLNNISDLSNLKSVSYLIEIKNNIKLTSLNGIQNVVYDNSLTGKKLFIQNNPEITTLEAISNYTFERGVINISNNSKLDNFCGLKKLLTEITHKEFDENNFIYNNAYNPSSKDILNKKCSSARF
ncbi:hypothetical protein [Tenacibaculum singaporense]|uniref:hypothetical protein n=1 Tax=Tenacibaculum singaporense TaxID=2358479 RepID=UPI000F67DC6E|nr:hypothetical protein [Tenacibaculum singaporense]RSC95741.1 hypothetical protein EI424_01110 [Tenacibaculum singaporense]